MVGRPAFELKEDLARQGILVRYYNNALLRDYIRISVGRPEDTERVLQALRVLQYPAAAPAPSRSPRQRPHGSPPADPAPQAALTRERRAVIERTTGETQVEIRLDVDGSGKHQIDTGLPFLDHMLAQIAVHGLFDLGIKAHGDLHIDPHHTMEDVALALGTAFQQALGDRAGIVRMASAECPMDESLAWVSLDFSGRPYSVIQVDWHAPSVGGLPVSLFPHFLESFAVQARCTLHVASATGAMTTTRPKPSSKPWPAPCAPPPASTPGGPARCRPVKGY